MPTREHPLIVSQETRENNPRAGHGFPAALILLAAGVAAICGVIAWVLR